MRAARTATTTASTPNSPYLQGAFVAMDPRNGAVRALVGGRDFDDSKFNRATQALGSPARRSSRSSTPRRSRTALRVVHPQRFGRSRFRRSTGRTWTPQNYDGSSWATIPLREALYISRNLATIRLGMELGEQSVINEARKFGITTPIPPYPSIHIGSADVYPIEMIAAYSAFATLGVRAVPTAISSVENAKGEMIWESNRARSERCPAKKRG